jgi:hypothetical protein
MPPRQQKEDRKQTEDPNAFFDRVLKAFRAEDVPEESTQKLASLRSLLKPRTSTVTMAAKNFTVEEAVFSFGLERKNKLFKVPEPGESLKWRIEEIPETKGFPMSSSLRKSFKCFCSTVDPLGSLMVWWE